MADIFSKKKRSEIMAGIRSKHTGPELAVRSMLHSMGVRFRLHDRDLPGTPDIVLRSRKTVVDVRGCFWHKHRCRWGARKLPKSNRPFWRKKLTRNAEKDSENRVALKAMGWRIVVVWECELRDRSRLCNRLAEAMI